MAEALIALGSNLGDSRDILRKALKDMEQLGLIRAYSSLYQTAPVGGPRGQPDYLNAVVGVALDAPWDDPQKLLAKLLSIEAQAGRKRRIRWEARTLDLDVLAIDDWVLDSADLCLPHPRMLARAFVMLPLCEIKPDWRHPQTQRSACDHAAELDTTGVKRLGSLID